MLRKLPRILFHCTGPWENTNSAFRALLLLIFSLSLYVSAHAQLTGTITVPNGTYPDLASVITDLNTQGVGAGGVTINITAGNAQSAPVGGYRLGSAVLNASTSAAKPLRINGNANTITAPVGTSTSLDGIFIISGVDYLTINGLNLSENVLNTTATTAMEFGYALFNRNSVAPFDGSQYDTIRNCTITLNRTIATASKAIYTAPSILSSTTGLLPTTISDTHSFNGFYNNTISNVITGIYIAGTTSIDGQGNDIGGTSPTTGNTITNCIGALYSSVGAITMTYNTNANISYNTINNTANGGTNAIATAWGLYAFAPNATITVNNNNITLTEAAISTAYAIYGIYGNAGGTNFTANNNTVTVSENAGSSAVNNIAMFLPNGNNTSISNNTVTQNMAVSGTTYGIYTTSTGIVLLNNNVLKQVSSVATSSQFYSIVNGGVAVSETVTNNTFNNSSIAVAGTLGYAALIYTANTTPIKNISNNGITGSITHNSSADFYGILCNPASAIVGGLTTIANNNFSNINKSGAGGLYAIYYAPTVAGTQNLSINNNTFSNLVDAGTGPVVAIYHATGATDSIFNNTISNCSAAGSLFGIYETTPNATLVRIYKNKLYNLSCTGTTSGGVFGITVSAGITASLYNNYIGDLTAPALSNTADVIRGISLLSTTANSAINVYYNTIRLSATSTGANFSTSGIYHTASATATTAALDMRNNIIINNSTPSGTGITAAFRRSSTALGNFAATSNNNILYAGTGANNLIAYDGTNSYATLTTYQAAVTPREAVSLTENPIFASLVGSAPNYLHFNPATITGAESGGAPIAGFTDDYDADIRQGNTGYTGYGSAPDIGADEWDNCTPVTVTTQPPATKSVCVGSNTTIVSAANNAPSYQWQFNTGSGWNNISNSAPYSNVTTNTLSIAGATAAINGYQYRVVFFDNCSVATNSNATTLSVVTVTSSITSQTNLLCNGASTGAAIVAGAGGATPYTYSWSPSGGNSATATGLLAGTYNVTITDNGGCPTVQPVILTQPSAIVTSVASQTNVSCNGGANATATIAASGGTGTLTYSWNTLPVQTTATATGLAAGSYNVTVKDANNCPVVQPVTITQPLALAATTSQINVFCSGGANGSASVVASGGTAPYTYVWTGSSSTTATASGLIAGSYSVVITDAKLCQITKSFVITQTASLASTNSQVNVSCFGGTNGSASIVITGGTSPYSYIWTGSPSVAATAPNLSAGSYSVTVKDVNNCQTIQPFTITQPTVIATSVSSQTSVSCFGGSDATATVAATGGVSPYTYAWNSTPVQNTAAATGLPAGSYIVTVTDANSCTKTQPVTITQPTAPLAVTTASNSPQCAGGSITITSAPTGGTSPYTYSWTGPGPYSGTASSVVLTSITTAMSGTYNLTVTDSKSCTSPATAVVSVTTIPAQPAAISGTATVCGGTVVTYRAAGQVPAPTSYIWTVPTGWTGTSTVDSIVLTSPVGIATGSLTVKAVNVCGTSTPATLAIASTVTPSQPGTITGSVAVCGGVAQNYSIAAVNQATSYTWTVPTGWTTPIPNTGSSIISTPSTTSTGNITVTASNVCGTSIAKTLPVTVTNIPATPGTITGNINVCGGTAQVYKIAKVNEATTYTWTVVGNGWTTTTGLPADSFVNSVAGTAGTVVTVTASNFCGNSATQTLPVTVTNIPGQPGTVSGRDSLCAGSGDIYSIGLVNEATSYTWTLPTTGGFTGTAAPNGLSFNMSSAGTTAAGIYTLTVKATNFCGSSPVKAKTITVTTPVVPAVSIISTNPVLCSGQSITFTAAGTNTGTAPIYQWMRNGLPVGTASSANTFTTSTLSNNDNISVQLHSSATCATLAWVTSNVIQVSVTQTLTPGISINSNYPASIICRNTPVIFTAANVIAGGANPQYQWKKNGSNVGGSSLNYTDAALNSGDSVSVIMTSSLTCVTQPTKESNKIGNTVYSVLTPTVAVQVSPGTNIAPGQSVTFTAQVTNVGINPQYQWLKNGIGIGGATTATYTTTTLTDGDAISLKVAADLPCASPGVVTSATKFMTVQKTGVNGYGVASDIVLYPNPTDGHFTVKINGYPKDKVLKIEVLNTVGQLVHTIEIRPNEPEWKQDIDLPARIASGAYMVRFMDDQNRMMAVKKLEVVR